MGLGGISIWQLLIIALIVVLLFGTKKLKNLGGDLGSAVRGFKNAMSEDEKKGEGRSDSPGSIESTAQKSESLETDKEKSQ